MCAGLHTIFLSFFAIERFRFSEAMTFVRVSVCLDVQKAQIKYGMSVCVSVCPKPTEYWISKNLPIICMRQSVCLSGCLMKIFEISVRVFACPDDHVRHILKGKIGLPASLWDCVRGFPKLKFHEFLLKTFKRRVYVSESFNFQHFFFVCVSRYPSVGLCVQKFEVEHVFVEK